MDTELRITDPSLKLLRTEVSQTLMEPLAIIEPKPDQQLTLDTLAMAVRQRRSPFACLTLSWQ